MNGNKQTEIADDAYVMARLKCSQRFVKRLRDERRVPVVKIGRKVLFTVEGIERYIAENLIDVGGR